VDPDSRKVIDKEQLFQLSIYNTAHVTLVIKA